MLPETINVYRLVPPEIIVDEKDALATLLFQISSAKDNKQHFSISPISSTLTYSDYTQLWMNTSSDNLPKEPDTVERIARTFFEKTNRIIANYKSHNRKSRLPPLFPQNLHLVGSRPVYTPNSINPDHWLVEFKAYLSPGGIISRDVTTTRSDNLTRSIAKSSLSAGELVSLPSTNQPGVEPDVPVDGSLIDVRIGAKGKIIGLWSRWRPYEKIENVKRLRPEPLPSNNESLPPIFYKLEDENDPQKFIAPYYSVADHDNVQTLPGSQYSLIVGISRTDYVERTELRAMALGYLGPLAYAWGCWRIDTDLSHGFEIIGNSSNVRMGSGIYNVVLDVLDTATGAIARRQSIIDSSQDTSTHMKRESVV